MYKNYPQKVVLIVAAAANGVIGDGRKMPWHIPTDLKHFHDVTMGDEKVVLMGRKTFESLPRNKLPGRTVFVLTRQPRFERPSGIFVHSIDEMFRQLSHRCTEVYVAGGGEVYAQMVDYADHAIVTRVDMYPAGGVRFPNLKDHGMQLEQTRTHPLDMTSNVRFGFEYWVRL